MSDNELNELLGLFFLALLLVLIPVSLVILARMGSRGIGTRPVRTVIRSGFIALVFAPGFLLLPGNPRLGIFQQAVMPAPFLFTLFQTCTDRDLAEMALGSRPAALAFTLPVALVWVLLSVVLLRLRQDGWPEDVKSTHSIWRFSWAGPLLAVAAFIAPPIFLGGFSPYPLLWAGGTAIAWSFFLLFLAKGGSQESPRWVLRLWLAACLFLGGFALVFGFGVGMAAGLH